MKLRTKTLLVISAVCSIFFIVMTSLLHIIVMGSYSTLEEKIVTDNIIRVLNQFEQEYNSLTQICYDWSTWDDTYTFVEDKNNEYIHSNLQYEIFIDIDVDFMIFYNQSGSFVYSKAFDLNTGDELSLPENLYSLINAKNEIFLHHPDYTDEHCGVILFDDNEDPILISATPIVKSNKDGPIHGTLIIGRYLNQERIEYLKDITQLSIVISSLSNCTFYSSSTQDFFTNGKRIFIQPINATYVEGYTIVDDIFGDPILLLQVGSTRDVYNQGLGVLQNLFIFLLITTFFLVITTIFILDKFVTSRLTVFSKSLGEIQDYQDLSKHIDITGDDEVSALGKNINIMLTSIQKLWSMKDSAENSLQKKIEELERFKTITIDREIKMIELKKQLNELKMKSGEKR